MSHQWRTPSPKEGVSRTYKGFDGYAPMMAYIGTEGYAINFELREGKQHCQNGTVEFLQETIRLCKSLQISHYWFVWIPEMIPLTMLLF